MWEVCHDVQVEPQWPHLQPLSDESLHYKSAVHEDDARIDIGAAGFWSCHHHHSFFDIRVFTFLHVVQQQLFEDMRVKNVELTRSMLERWKEAILLLLCSLFQGACAAVTYQCLAFLLSDKWKSSFSVIMGWLHCSLDFSLLYSFWCVSMDPDQVLVVQVFLLLLISLLLKVSRLATNDVWTS